MVYQHKGERYNDPFRLKEHKIKKIVKKPKIIRQYFVIEFECDICAKSHRLKELKIDPIHKFHCIYCGSLTFRINKRRIGDTSIPGENNIIMIENYIKKEA